MIRMIFYAKRADLGVFKNLDDEQKNYIALASIFCLLCCSYYDLRNSEKQLDKDIKDIQKREFH